MVNFAGAPLNLEYFSPGRDREMAGRGRAPTPTSIAKLHGSPGHARPANRHEPLPPDPVVASELPPADFTPGQRDEWVEALAAAPPELLRRLDRQLLRAWCILADAARIAGNELGAKGPFYDHPVRGRVSNGAFKVHIEATAALIRLSDALGFSPSARARVYRDGFENRPAGPTLVPQSANPKPGEAVSLATFIANSPSRPPAA